MAQKHGCDVREELKNYSRDNTADTFNRMQAHRRDMIQRQRESGGLGMLTSISKQNQKIGNLPAFSKSGFGKDE